MYEMIKTKKAIVPYPHSLLRGDVYIRETRKGNSKDWVFLLQRGEKLRWISTAAGQEVPDDFDSIDDAETAQLVSEWEPKINMLAGKFH